MFFKSGKTTSLFFTSSVLIMIALVVHYAGTGSGPGLPRYGDEDVYIECGVSYLGGAPPIECNFEHPPLAKYLIGLLYQIDPWRLSLRALYAGSALVIYVICKRLGLGRVAFICSTLFLLDTIVFNTYRFYLLDPFSVFFVLLSVYFSLHDRLIYSAIVMGLALASKLSAIPVFIGLVVFYLLKRRYRHLLVYTILVIVVYAMSYSADLSTGVDGIVRHHVMMYEYMSWRHGFSLPIALNGLTRLIARLEQWFYAGDIYIQLSISESSVVVFEETFREKSGKVLIVSIGAGSPVWYLFLPVLLFNTYRVFIHSVKDELKLMVLLAWLSLINVFAGTLDWYYVNTLPFLYINLCTFLHSLGNRRRVYVLIVTVVLMVQVLFFTATITGLLPFIVKYVFT